MSEPMNIHLIHGAFSTDDALELITQMVQVKIKFHEDRIGQNSSEEDIKYRESKIKQFQKELFQLRRGIDPANKRVILEAIINIERQ